MPSTTEPAAVATRRPRTRAGAPARLLRELALAILCVAACAVVGWSFSWLGLAMQAAAERAALDQGTSPIAFDFNDLGQLIGRRAEGGRDLRRADTGIEMLVGQRGLDVGLNFRSRQLDLQRFPDLRLVLELGDAGLFTPIVENRAGQRWTALDPVPLVKGLNPIRLDLKQMRWTLGAAGGAAVAAAAGPGRISALRLFIGAPENTRVLLREARFYAAGTPVALFTLAPGLAMPEQWLRSADQVRADSPETIIQPPGMAPDWQLSARLWWVLAALAAALVCGLAILGVRRAGPVAMRAVGCWSLLAFPVLALWIGDDPQLGLLGFGLGAALIGVRRLPPAPPVRGAARAWLETALVTALALGALAQLPGVVPEWSLPHRPWVYLLWALLQQAVLQRLLYARLRKTLGPGWSGWIAALGFALWHAPNLGLMLLTLIGGRLWCELYERNGRLAPVVASHALIGLVALQWLTPELLRSAEVSARFLWMQ